MLLQSLQATQILIPMDNAQNNHLKAYGIAFWVLKQGVEIQWLLNYRGGSYLFDHHKVFEDECVIQGCYLPGDHRGTSHIYKAANCRT